MTKRPARRDPKTSIRAVGLMVLLASLAQAGECDEAPAFPPLIRRPVEEVLHLRCAPPLHRANAGLSVECVDDGGVPLGPRQRWVLSTADAGVAVLESEWTWAETKSGGRETRWNTLTGEVSSFCYDARGARHGLSLTWSATGELRANTRSFHGERADLGEERSTDWMRGRSRRPSPGSGPTEASWGPSSPAGGAAEPGSATLGQQGPPRRPRGW